MSEQLELALATTRTHRFVTHVEADISGQVNHHRELIKGPPRGPWWLEIIKAAVPIIRESMRWVSTIDWSGLPFTRSIVHQSPLHPHRALPTPTRTSAGRM